MPWFVIIHVFQCLPHQHVIHMCCPCSSSGDTRDSLLHACRAPETRSMTQARFGILSLSSLCSGFEEVKQVALWSEERRAGLRPLQRAWQCGRGEVIERSGTCAGVLRQAERWTMLHKYKWTETVRRQTGVGRVRARPHLQIITYINNWCSGSPEVQVAPLIPHHP